jgi:hypothetical protein
LLARQAAVKESASLPEQMMMFFYDFITRLPHGFPLINSILAN